MSSSCVKLMWMLTLYVATSQAEVQPKVKILVIGRTGSGKSTLINNILGRPVAEVGNRPFPKTKTVSVYQKEIHGVHVTACDAPGLGDASRNEGDYINKMKNNCGDPDLVLFCLNMDNTRWHDDDEEAIKSVTNHLDKRVPCSEADFEERISDLETLFKATLTKVGVSSSNIPSAVSAKGCKDLPGVSNWLTELMVTCLTQIKEGGKEGLRQMILWRLKFPNEINKDDIEKPEYEQPFVFTESLCSLLKLNPGTWSGMILGMKAGGYLGGTMFGARFGAFLGGPFGSVLGGIAGYGLEYILSFATCENFMDDEKDEL